MERRILKRVLLRLLCLAVAVALGGAAVAQTGNLAKIDPELQEQMHQSRDATDRFRVIVEMAEQYDNPNLERGTALMTRAQRRDYVVNELKHFSENSQAEVVGFLTNQSMRGQVNVLHRFWIFNGVCCEATAECIGELSMRQDVRYVSLDVEMKVDELVEVEEGDRSNPPQSGIQWHVSKVRADEVWNYPNTQGFTGRGVVVAIIDTGVNYDHSDISHNMWEGGGNYPNHGWDFALNNNDPKDELANSPDAGHGTHVAGIVAGDGALYKTGVAPGAKIMAIKMFYFDDQGKLHGNESNMLAGTEFALEQGADIMNYSVSSEDGNGGYGSVRDAMVNLLNAGVIAVAGAGNTGEMNLFGILLKYPVPYNVHSPGNCPPPWRDANQMSVSRGDASAVICVGNTKMNDKKAKKSSIGPVTWAMGSYIGDYNDYPYYPEYSTISGLIRPDVSAPGDKIWSLAHNSNNQYCKKSGTSMATPCVSGVIALMLEANPYLTPAKIDSILETTAVACDGQSFKNNEYGAGRVDAYAAVTAALQTNMPQQYRISVSKFPFDCECAHVSGDSLYQPGELCTLQASPAEFFLHWEKDGEIIPGGATLSFQVTENAQYTAVFEENVACYFINVADNPSGAAAGGSGWGHYYSGQTCTLTAIPNERYVFYNWTKDGEEVSTNAEFSFTVSEDALYVANFKRLCNITTVANPVVGGNVLGGGTYMTGDPCTVTAIPNTGYAFAGWYNGAIMVSMLSSYTFTVNGDRNLTAMFAPRDYTITVNALPMAGGTISGGGTFPSGSVVTVLANANTGYRFNGWVENGHLVATETSYMFVANADRNLIATFVCTQSGSSGIGSVVTNADGTHGVLFHIEPSGVGWMVAMNDVSEGCPWGPTTNIDALPDYPGNNVIALGDLSGLKNTGILRTILGTDNDFAASKVNFDHGWYLPSAGQLRKLYATLPFVDSVLYYHGGSTLSEDTYWSSTEYSSSDAISPMFAMNNSNKSTNRRVRAIRNYYSPEDNMVLAMPDSPTHGTVSVYNNGVYSYGADAAVIAYPKTGYVFDHWEEDGLPVSYDHLYTFTFTHSRQLIAYFAVSGSVGTVVHNADGSDGVVFYMNPEGTEGLMVALEDASAGCQWGTNSNIAPLQDYPLNDMFALNDMSGSHNTGVLRNAQGLDSTYAATVVDYANGWYLPSAGELRKLYAALPLIETALVSAGGTTLTEDTYWSSTEYSTSDALTASFSMSNVSKTSVCRVRAIRKFLTVGAHTLVAKANNEALGTVSGSGDYEYNETVTVSAEPNEGYVFQSWTEDGIVVSNDATWQFPFTRNRVLVANFIVAGAVGEIVHNADGSTGVVFYQNAEGTEGWMVALEDASVGCPWGPESNIQVLNDYSCNGAILTLEDLSGFSNTATLRKAFGTNNDYAASVVDFANGWYLPSAGQLRKLYAALPMIEESIINAGGTPLTEDAYWSSSEYSSSDACSPMFAMNNANKTSLLRVRAVRTFNTEGVNSVRLMANNMAFGGVAGSGTYALGATVNAIATSNTGYVFDHWEEDGCVVSYNNNYTFEFTRTRTLTAVFVRENSIGSIVHNADGTTGVIFYTYPSGIGGLMVALEDVSEGCPWGLNEDITIMDNQSPSAVMDLLNDMCGKSNTNRIREWYSGNTDYAACKTDFANGWYLPSAGQLRKLYAALPLIERAIVDAGGTTMTEGTYWSSTEQSASNAWTPMFAMSSTNKTSNCRVRAIRSLTDTKTILANVNIEGGGSVTGVGWYDHGQTCTLKAQANETYAFLNWTCGGSVVSTNMEFSFTVLENQTYTANFVANSCNITTAMNPANSGTVTGAGIYAIDSICTLTATPAEGYTFVNWTENGVVASISSTYQFVVTGSRTLQANFSKVYTITAIVYPEDGGAIEGAGVYEYGTMATLTAIANFGYEFFCWFEDDDIVSFDPSMSFEVTENREIYAVFVEGSSTFTKEINAYTESGGYYLLAVPLTEVDPGDVEYMLDNVYDLYEYDEAEELEWRNYKRHAFNFQLGKGYLYANSGDVTLTFTGTPNSANCTVTLSKTGNAETAGWNLVGNPFNQTTYLNRDFYVMNAAGNEIMAAQRNYIMPMEGVFVVANYNGESITFTQSRSANDDKRIVLNLSKGSSSAFSMGSATSLETDVIDRVIVRFAEGRGLPKFQIKENSTKLFIQQDSKDYAVVCANGIDELPICFEAEKNGTYTISFDNESVGFSHLHLIDHLTGNDIDLLETPSYTFEASAADNVSRFMLVFGLK